MGDEHPFHIIDVARESNEKTCRSLRVPLRRLRQWLSPRHAEDHYIQVYTLRQNRATQIRRLGEVQDQWS